MRIRRPILGLLALAIALAIVPAEAKEPEVVVVQHILVSYKGRLPKKQITRTKKEAKALAEELLRRAQEGEEFDALVKEYTDDRYPGIYTLTNAGAPLLPGAVTRGDFVSAFGDVAFRLGVGEVGSTRYNSLSSPYGWHIIKRLE